MATTNRPVLLGSPLVGPSHRTVADWVAAQLRDAIFGGRLAPKAPLPLVEFAQHFGVSTTPLRHALLRLQEEGLVVGDPHKSFRVASLTLSDIRDIHLLHGSLSGILAERAAGRLTESDLAKLEDLQRQIKSAADSGDYAALHEANFAFHRLLNLAAGTSPLHRFILVTSRYVSRRTYPEVSGWLEGASGDHGLILEALRHRDGAKVRRLIENHVNEAGERLIADLRSRGEWTE